MQTDEEVGKVAAPVPVIIYILSKIIVTIFLIIINHVDLKCCFLNCVLFTSSIGAFCRVTPHQGCTDHFS